jgi:hypothetical protein
MLKIICQHQFLTNEIYDITVKKNIGIAKTVTVNDYVYFGQ